MPFALVYGISSWRNRLRRRSSAGSMPISRAEMSSSTSRATDSNCHGPRYAERPGRFEYIALAVNDTFGTRYGPGKNTATTAVVPIGHGVGYAPQSDT